MCVLGPHRQALCPFNTGMPYSRVALDSKLPRNALIVQAVLQSVARRCAAVTHPFLPPTQQLTTQRIAQHRGHQV